MKIAIATATFFGTAIVDMLEAAGYAIANGAFSGSGTDAFVLANTTKKTFKDASTNEDRPTYDPTMQWAAISALVAPVAATPTLAPAASAQPAQAVAGLRVGDQVRATNGGKTKAKFRLDTNRVYTIARFTAKGNVGLEGLPNDEYLITRFTKVATTTGSSTAAPIATPTVARPTYVAPTPAPRVVAVPARDERGNTLRVGDKVLVNVANPNRRDRKFVLTGNEIKTITVITAKGNIGFGGADQYKANRFRKVTLSAAKTGSTVNVRSGDLVVAAASASGRFPLPQNIALTFRGVTVEGGAFILDGYTRDQYAANRFQKVNLVG